MELDPAICKALSLDPSKTTIATHGGSGFASTAKISTHLENGLQRQFFMKTGTGRDKSVMFEGEHASLNAIHDTVPSLCPASLAYGKLEEKDDSYFLVTEFLDLQSRSIPEGEGSGMNLATKLAKLHDKPVPVPKGYSKPMYGFPVTTSHNEARLLTSDLCCGDTPQTNEFREDWADFYANNRLLSILDRSESNNGHDAELSRMVNRTAHTVVPRLLRKGHLGGAQGIFPCVVHGDLWAGNRSKGQIAGEGGVEEIVFDPSACYAHNEYELGIMRMFGGFGGSFLKEYHAVKPKTEPVEEYEDRVSLYELYHHLNHHAIFGGSYKSGAMTIMRDLWRKYGDE